AWEEQQRFPIQVVTSLSQQLAHRGLQFFKVNKNITHVCVARPHFLDVGATPVSENVKKMVDFINATPKCTRRKLIDSLSPVSVETTATETKTETAEPLPEQKINADLHWLVHQGHVIEFSNGILETAKKPLFKPPQPPKPKEENLPGTQGESVPNESVETIEPRVSELEAVRPVRGEPTEKNSAPESNAPPLAEGEPKQNAEPAPSEAV
ncbi:MAG: hypothetical protein ACR2H1_00820, partial [Limisphaerales bacterium]